MTEGQTTGEGDGEVGVMRGGVVGGGVVGGSVAGGLTVSRHVAR